MMKNKKNWKVAALLTTVLLALMCSQVFAAVAPSVSSNKAPTLKSFTAPDGTLAIGYYTDPDGNVFYLPVSIENIINIIADADIEKSLTGEELAAYQAAKEELLNPDSGFYTKLDDFFAQAYPELEAGEFAVRDLFDITVPETMREAALTSANKLSLTFYERFNQDDVVIVTVYNTQTGEWDIIGRDDVTVNADGTITVNFSHLCPVAVLTADATAARTPIKTEDTKVENTDTAAVAGETAEEGSGGSMLIPILGGVAVIGVVIGFIIYKKRQLW